MHTGGMISRARSMLRALHDDERGDVPGWVLVTLMTAGLANPTSNRAIKQR